MGNVLMNMEFYKGKGIGFLNLDKLNINQMRTEIDYLDFVGYLLEREELDEGMNVITYENWNEFHCTDDEEYEMKINRVEAGQDFYKKAFNMTANEFAKNFVCLEELEGYEDDTYLRFIKLNIGGIQQGFIIDGGM
ncbi:hypothetical protein OD350_24780 [Clostridium beijerinckii]|uniref:Uncharacterized protein n=1 Tax=Clostridium beijerinckii TaxID=1520 RepID=A0AAX0B4T0_CLOBE|nr:hypothetical protein [Clostridium beijerinckii]NRT90208.1 hypothetical protein [Clostridium beijerinckii]NYC69738.1 hypothetical protein [Clostridium beijerinckii]UYZ35387.1 hypothetical protein OD350_24780 [Clostridium beijerinckii]